MRLNALILMSFLAGGAVPFLAHAQSSDGGGSSTIVVIGKRLSKPEALEKAKVFVRTALAQPAFNQYARWKDPVCPRVFGLSDSNATYVVNRVRTIAADVKAPVARAKCVPNLHIVFTDDGVEQMSAILRKSSRLGRDLSPREFAILVHEKRPVRWWHVAQIEGIDGHKAGGDSTSAALLGSSIDGGAGGGANGGAGANFVSSGQGTPYIDGYSATLVGTSVRVHFDSAGVVVDANRAAGRTLSAVANYVAMVSLAALKMDDAGAPPESILNVFQPGSSAPTELSHMDRAFLRALYSGRADRDRRQQAGAIAVAMAEAPGRE